jgi:Xaa-Pro aminopeptidase
MSSKNLDGFYISSYDAYLNEYTPLEECHRYYITSFTGSVAEVFAPAQGKVRLYVDGRYHEQADLEVNHDLVHVVKCSTDSGPFDRMLKDLKELNLNNIGIESDRTPLGCLKKIKSITNTTSFHTDDFAALLNYQFSTTDKPIYPVERNERGRDTLQKLSEIFETNTHGYFITALDSIAWLANARGFHLPYQSTFKAKALATKEKLYIFVEPSVQINSNLLKDSSLEFLKLDSKQFLSELRHLQNKLHLEKIYFDPNSVNASDADILNKVFGQEILVEKNGGITSLHSIKEPLEIKEIESCFDKSDKAIFNTIKWVKKELQANRNITELDLYNQTNLFYKEQGAVEQSFKTISGCGPNSSIIHYSNPSQDVVLQKTDMVLLDSGGYYNSGFATDTTRTFLCDENSTFDPKYKEIYTLVLKGLLQAMNAVIPEGTKGIVIDALARQPMLRHGYNYSHGTGHGVGINVHEDGIRFSLLSQYGIYPGQVVSIEPGIYLPKFGGVRLENIIKVEKHSKYNGYVCFKSLVHIGFEPNLIDMNLLTDEEKKFLSEYEDECSKRKRSFLN